MMNLKFTTQGIFNNSKQFGKFHDRIKPCKFSKPTCGKPTRTIYVGRVPVGGSAPVTVQSMTKTDTRDLSATVDQIHRLQDAGCEIIRVAVPDREAGENLGAIKKAITIPLVADIHFDYRLALLALEQGVDGLRLNPGNIGSRERIAKVVEKAKERKRSDPRRRKRGIPGKEGLEEIRGPHGGSARGKRLEPRPPAGG